MLLILQDVLSHLADFVTSFGLIQILGLVIATLLFLYSRNYFGNYLSNYPPGPTPWPLFGNYHLLKNKPHLKLTNLRKNYGDIYSLKLGSRKVVVVCSMEGVKEALIEHGEDYANRPDCPSSHLLYDGDRQRGIASADMTDLTFIKRKFLSDIIDSKCSEGLTLESAISAEAEFLIDALLENKSKFNPEKFFKHACMNISLWLMFCFRLESNSGLLKQLLSILDARAMLFHNNSHDFLSWMVYFRETRLHFIREKVHLQVSFLQKVLNHHKDNYNADEHGDVTDDLLSLLANNEDCGIISKEDLDYLLVDMMNSGILSTCSILLWIIGFVAVFPEVQVKVQEEIDSVVGRDRFPSLTDQVQLPFTEAVILETQRIASVYPFLLPHVTSKNTILRGFDIPKDTCMLFNAWSIHHDPKYWKNPMKFDPERFLTPENTIKIPDHKYIPYGCMTRQCPGESLADVEIFLLFTHLMQQINIKCEGNLVIEGEYCGLHKPKPYYIEVEQRV